MFGIYMFLNLVTKSLGRWLEVLVLVWLVMVRNVPLGRWLESWSDTLAAGPAVRGTGLG